MKTLLAFFCAFTLVLTAQAQNSYPVIIKVQYNFIHVRDTTQRDKPYTETMMLLAGKEASYYTSFDRVEGAVTAQLKAMEDRKNGLSSSSSSGGKTVSQVHFYLFPKEHKYINYEQMTINYLVEGDIENINWKILKDTANFSGIHAQKATATYKGRNWTAWFAPELPFTYGPWKLQGLPGLIVEAYDDKKEVQFKFAGVEKVKAGDVAVAAAPDLPGPVIKSLQGLDVSEITVLPQRPVNTGGPIKIKKEEYERLKAQQDKDPIGFMTAQFAVIGLKDPAGMAQSVANGTSRGGGGGGSNGSNNPTPNEKTPMRVNDPVNNPIELGDKK